MKRVVTTLAVLLGAALAHAELRGSAPAADSAVKAAPKTVTIRFSEPVEVRLSVFKVYPLAAPTEAWGSPARLRQLARALTRQVLPLKNDAARRADAGVSTPARTTATVTLALKPGLKPGPYAVMWRNLATDGHTSSGFFVFVYKP